LADRKIGTTKHIGAAGNQPVLLFAQVTFQTYNECKDDDTHVEVVVKNAVNDVAYSSSDYYHFRDNSINGPFPMTVQPVSKDQLQPAYVDITIKPNGHDTWHFSFTIDLTLSDGSHIIFTSGEIELKQRPPGPNAIAFQFD